MPESELDDNPLPYLTTRRWVKEKHQEWGPGHPLWESRVLGNFPQQSEDALLSLAWLEAAKNRETADGPMNAASPNVSVLDCSSPCTDVIGCDRAGRAQRHVAQPLPSREPLGPHPHLSVSQPVHPFGRI